MLNALTAVTPGMLNPEDAHERLQAAVADCRRIGDPRLTAIALNNLSWMAVRLGRYGEARAALEESVVLNTSIGDRWNLGFAYRGLGLIAQAQGEHLQAVDMFRKSLDMFIEIGARQDSARVLVEMSHSIFALGSDAEAERGWREALRITTETSSAFVALEALVGMAMLKMIPEAGAGISVSTLSVLTSTNGSYCSTASPGFFSHLVSVPSTTDSPNWGIRTCVGMALLFQLNAENDRRSRRGQAARSPVFHRRYYKAG